MIRVGQVTGAFGVQGAVKVLPLTDFDDRFRPGSALIVEGVTRHVEWSREQSNGLVVKLTGLDNRTLAELHRGRYLEVPVDAVHRLPEGEFYHHQLVGLEVVTASGARLGRVAEVLEHLVPATREAVVGVDLDSRRVVVADWLLEVEDA